ncbi:peptidoglycan DD-metalloendopeptidase family protein [Ectobacillus polymachus]|uniref:peptidoglycan DD-metalloendopeptidase family protein n=1 Tax=Ectobacillus polymachus TaxID=1508806 RepID=UPI003A8AA306
MNKKRINQIRKRIEKRKAKQLQMTAWKEIDEPALPVEEQSPAIIEEVSQEHPLFKKEIFLMKILFSSILVLGTAIIMKNPSSSLQDIRKTIETTMHEEFQFAYVSQWYEQQFGKPLTFLPSSEKKESGTYAVPATGKVLQTFKSNGQGVIVETSSNAVVDAVDGGVAIFVGKKADLGNTIIIQHGDGTQSWYGNLSQVSVSVYDSVKKQQKIGVVQNNGNGKTGNFYFALKKNEMFIDPIQVISFE